MQGVPLPIVARLLSHRHPSMTLRYAHVGDSEIEAAAGRIGQNIARLMAGEVTAHRNRQDRPNAHFSSLRRI